MPSAIELSIRHGVALPKIEAIAEELEISLDEPSFIPDDDFMRASSDIKRGRLSPYVVAYWLRTLTGGSEESSARHRCLTDLAEGRGGELSDIFIAIEWRTIASDKLSGAKIWLDRAVAPQPDVEALEHLGNWCKIALAHADGEKDHHYLAVRLLLSLPEREMRNYPKIVQSTLHRVKHYGCLAGGWFTLEKDARGCNKTIYHAANGYLDL